MALFAELEDDVGELGPLPVATRLEQGEQLVIRAPIRVEADGSFRMNAPVRDGADAYLLVGSRFACEQAAQHAAQQALQQLEGSKPAFVFVLVDIAWEMLLKSHPGAEINAVQDILGARRLRSMRRSSTVNQ